MTEARLRQSEAESNLVLYEADWRFAESVGIAPTFRSRKDGKIIVSSHDEFRANGESRSVYTYADGSVMWSPWGNWGRSR